MKIENEYRIEPKTTANILRQEKPFVDKVESNVSMTNRERLREVNAMQALSASQQSPNTLQLRDIKKIQMGAYASNYDNYLMRASPGSVAISVIGTVLVTLVAILSILMLVAVLSGLNFRNVETSDLEPNVFAGDLLVEKAPELSALALDGVVALEQDGNTILRQVFFKSGDMVYLYSPNLNLDGEGYISLEDLASLRSQLRANPANEATILQECIDYYGVLKVSFSSIDSMVMVVINSAGAVVTGLFANWYIALIVFVVIFVALLVWKRFIDRRYQIQLLERYNVEKKMREERQRILAKDIVQVQRSNQSMTSDPNIISGLLDINKKQEAHNDFKLKKLSEELQKRKSDQIDAIKLNAQRSAKGEKAKSEPAVKEKTENRENPETASAETPPEKNGERKE